METKVEEIGERIYRLCTLVDRPRGAFGFNQFLVDAEEPLLFHCGHRAMFPSVSAAVARVMPLERLRWISFGHVEADECGAMNQWLAAAPRATVLHGQIACRVSLTDMADRPPRALEDGEALEIGGRRLRLIATPHVPHGWEAIVLHEEVTQTLLSGDIATNVLNDRLFADDGVVEAALAMEDAPVPPTALTPQTAPTLRKLAALEPKSMAVMHGASVRGDCAAVLRGLADGYQRLFER
jgi:flavorubredoxin